jgi:hypothetical protein
MAFRLPNFNLTANINTGPLLTLAFRFATSCNLAWGTRVNQSNVGGSGVLGVPLTLMDLLLPPGVDVRGPLSATLADIVEVPAGSGRFYTVTFVDDIGKGFPNEHRCAVISQVRVPTPLP